MDDQEVTNLTTEECWALLADQRLGRLAFHLADQVHIAPINFVVDDGSLLFCTAEGSKLLGVVMNPDVAFEVDDVEEHWATSVIVRGAARLLDEHAAHRADDLPVRPWVGTGHYNVVELVPTEVTGRRFRLHRA